MAVRRAALRSNSCSNGNHKNGLTAAVRRYPAFAKLITEPMVLYSAAISGTAGNRAELDIVLVSESWKQVKTMAHFRELLKSV